jgi:hypothetical protein
MTVLKFILYIEQTCFWRMVTWSRDRLVSGWIIWTVVLVKKSSDSVILISIWAWMKLFAPINSRQDTKNQILIDVLVQHSTDKPYIVC